MTARIFDVRAPRTAPFGLVGWIFMGLILGGIPLFGLVMAVTQMGASSPGVAAAVAAVCLIPIAVLYAVYRLFTKFRLSILSDGTVEFVEPFKTTRLTKAQLASAHWRSTYMAPAKTRVNWLILADGSGTGLAAISPMSFGAGALTEFLEALKAAHPGLTISQG
jgi:hypothetical protein